MQTDRSTPATQPLTTKKSRVSNLWPLHCKPDILTIRAKLHYTDTGYEHHQRTKIRHIPTSWHVEMLGSGIAMWQVCCRIVVSLSVGGVRSQCPCSGVWLLRHKVTPDSMHRAYKRCQGHSAFFWLDTSVAANVIAVYRVEKLKTELNFVGGIKARLSGLGSRTTASVDSGVTWQTSISRRLHTRRVCRRSCPPAFNAMIVINSRMSELSGPPGAEKTPPCRIRHPCRGHRLRLSSHVELGDIRGINNRRRVISIIVTWF